MTLFLFFCLFWNVTHHAPLLAISESKRENMFLTVIKQYLAGEKRRTTITRNRWHWTNGQTWKLFKNSQKLEKMFMNFPFLLTTKGTHEYSTNMRKSYMMLTFIVRPTATHLQERWFIILNLWRKVKNYMTPFFWKGPNFCTKFCHLKDFSVRRSSYHLKA